MGSEEGFLQDRLLGDHDKSSADLKGCIDVLEELLCTLLEQSGMGVTIMVGEGGG